MAGRRAPRAAGASVHRSRGIPLEGPSPEDLQAGVGPEFDSHQTNESWGYRPAVVVEEVRPVVEEEKLAHHEHLEKHVYS